MADTKEGAGAPRPKARRGFAAMDPAKRREIARQGGAAVAPEKRTFSLNKHLAVEAGRKGGGVSRGGGRKPGTTDSVAEPKGEPKSPLS